MILIILVAVFIATFMVVYGSELFWVRKQRVKSRAVAAELGFGSSLLRSKDFIARGMQEKFLEVLAASGQWFTPDLDKVTEMRRDLIRAGYRRPQAVTIYLGFRIFTAFVFTLPVAIYCVIRAEVGSLIPLVIALVFGFFGFFIPTVVLSYKIKHRQERLDQALPDILDMFVICMEAGLSLNASLQRVADETRAIHPDFSDELQIATGELRTGLPWSEAFDNMAQRTGVQSIRSVVGLMVQSQKLGASIGEDLRHHAEFVRTQRLLRAEERAAKLPVKIIFPLIFCILPAILIVVAGPGLIQMARWLSGGLGIGGGTLAGPSSF
ncbi:MAG: type II secretion system F family protein [Desulfobaccales bacterium]